MLTRTELESNYRNFTDARLVELAKEPDGLSLEALDVLEKELAARDLNFTINPQSGPVDHRDFFPEPSELLIQKFPNAIQIFSFQTRSILTLSLFFLFSGFLLIYFSQPMGGHFSILTYLGFLFVILSAFVWVNVRTKNAMIVLYDDKILFKQKLYRLGSKLSILELFRLLFSTKFIQLNKSEIKAIVRPTNFLRTSHFHFLTINGDQIEINFFASEAYFEHMHAFLEDDLNGGVKKT